jgi:hypothetical protein
MGKAGRHGQSQSPQQQDSTPSSLSPNGRERENATSGEGRLKSRLEIALERLKEESPEGEPRSLTDKQKERIATIRREYQAKLAEAEILHHTAVKKELLRATPETLQKVGQIKEDYARQTAKLQTQMEKKIEQVRRRGAKQT